MEKIIEILDEVLKEMVDKLPKDASKCDDETCKTCKFHNICDRFNQMIEIVEDKVKDEQIRLECLACLAFFKNERKRIALFNKEMYFKNINQFSIDTEYRRFESLIRDFKHWDVIRNVLPMDDLAYLRVIVRKTNSITRSIFASIIDDNSTDYLTINQLLTKEEAECPKELDYDNMSKEELIKILKDK